jgi:hypothetical protein
MTVPIEPSPVPPAPVLSPPLTSEPVQVIGYAGIGTDYVVPTGVKVLLGFLAAFHFLVGLPMIVSPIVSIVTQLVSYQSFDPSAAVGFVIGFAAGAPNIACGLMMLWKRRRGTWKAIHGILFALCALELIVFGFGAVLVVMYKHATGWDGLGLAFGLFFAILASIPFWLHAGSKLALLHPRVRRAFLFERDEPIRLQRMGTIVMMSLYGAALLIGVMGYVVR